jgi:hypothetical protein
MHAEDGTSITTKRVLGTRRKKTCAQETGERKTPQKKSRQRTGYIDGGCSSGLRWFRPKAHLYTRPWLFSVKVSVAIWRATPHYARVMWVSIQRAIRTYLMLWYARVADSLDLWRNTEPRQLNNRCVNCSVRERRAFLAHPGSAGLFCCVLPAAPFFGSSSIHPLSNTY